MGVPKRVRPGEPFRDIYRPMGAGAATYSNVACELIANFKTSRCSVDAIDWTHVIEVANTVDILDGCSRLLGSNALGYADGDEVRIPSGVNNRYVVVWVEPSASGGKRVYLMRHSIGTWTNL